MLFRAKLKTDVAPRFKTQITYGSDFSKSIRQPSWKKPYDEMVEFSSLSSRKMRWLNTVVSQKTVWQLKVNIANIFKTSWTNGWQEQYRMIKNCYSTFDTGPLYGFFCCNTHTLHQMWETPWVWFFFTIPNILKTWKSTPLNSSQRDSLP